MSNVTLKAKILDFSGIPEGNAPIIVNSFRPPYFESAGESLQSETKKYFTPPDEIVEEDVALVGLTPSTLTRFPLGWIVVTSTDGRTKYLEDVDYTIDLVTGDLTRFAQAQSIDFTLSGTVEASDTFRITLNGNNHDYPMTGGEANMDAVAAALAAVISESGLTASNPGAPSSVVRVTADVPGVAFTYASSVINAGGGANDQAIVESVVAVNKISGITDGQTVHTKYLALSDGEVDIPLARAMAVRIRVPFTGYDEVADLSTIDGGTTEVTLEDLQSYPLVQS